MHRSPWASCVAVFRAAMTLLSGFMHTVTCGLCGRRLVTVKEVSLPKRVTAGARADGLGGQPAARPNGSGPVASEVGSQTALVAAGHGGTSQEVRAPPPSVRNPLHPAWQAQQPQPPSPAPPCCTATELVFRSP